MMTAAFTAFCYGIACTGAFCAALFFFRFWRLSGDSFFLWFTASFALLSLQWLVLVSANPDAESRPYYYVLRLIAFVLIIGAVVEKNRRPEAPVSRRHSRQPDE